MTATQKQFQKSRGSKSHSPTVESKRPSSTHAVDILNFFLIWFTLAIAMAWPFQLFLFSYIVIGPWHYLTEINWLDKQKYFLPSKDSRVFVWTMAGLVLLLTAGTLFPATGTLEWTKPIYNAVYGSPGNPVAQVVTWS